MNSWRRFSMIQLEKNSQGISNGRSKCSKSTKLKWIGKKFPRTVTLYGHQPCWISSENLLFGILCIKRLISCIRQLAEGVVLIDFANQFFQFSGSLLGSSQTPALFRYIGTLLSNLRLLNSVNKFRPVISRIFSDSPERVGNQCQDSTLIDTVLCRA